MGPIFDEIWEPDSAKNQTRLKIHVSNGYLKGICKMICYGPLRAFWPLKLIHQFRARAKITSHFKRRCILPGGVAKARNMPDIPALSRLARQAPQHFKFVNLFLRDPLSADGFIYFSKN